jgi:hypothetical protein
MDRFMAFMLAPDMVGILPLLGAIGNGIRQYERPLNRE